MTPDPREDALAKLLAEVKERISNCGPCVHVYALHAKLDKALSAPPSQSENFLTGYGHQVSQWTEAAVAEQAARSTAAFTSPTPYVRPAAEIRAEIERAKRHYGLSLKLEGYIAGLTFALTPPTTEKETP